MTVACRDYSYNPITDELTRLEKDPLFYRKWANLVTSDWKLPDLRQIVSDHALIPYSKQLKLVEMATLAGFYAFGRVERILVPYYTCCLCMHRWYTQSRACETPYLTKIPKGTSRLRRTYFCSASNFWMHSDSKVSQSLYASRLSK